MLYPTSFIQTQATATVLSSKNPNRRIAPFWLEMGQRNLALRMSSKPEILLARYSSANYFAIPQVLSGHRRPDLFPRAMNSDHRIASFGLEMGQHNLALRLSSKLEILRGRYSSAYYCSIPQVLSRHKRPAQCKTRIRTSELSRFGSKWVNVTWHLV
jgi:hypothetical protein